MSARKIPSDLENPLDDIFIDMGEYFSEYFRKMNLTANDLTSISFLTGIYSIYLFTQQKYILSAIFYIISHMFDCFDGYYARKYNLVSEFGDYYDHITDYLIDGIMIYLIARKFLQLPNNKPLKYVPLLFIPIIILDIMQFGCQEKYNNTNSKGNSILANLKPACPINDNDKDKLSGALSILRFFGSGTFYFFICILILLSAKVDEEIVPPEN